MRMLACNLFAVLILVGCASYPPPGPLTGATAQDVVAQMGQPESRRSIDGGTRLEYPRGPYGKHTWFVDLDAAGKVVRTQQVLIEANFNQIQPGMAEQEVRNRLGRPGEVRQLARARGVVWSYRYENPFCLWFQVEIAADHTVRSAGRGEPPECGRREIIIIP